MVGAETKMWMRVKGTLRTPHYYLVEEEEEEEVME